MAWTPRSEEASRYSESPLPMPQSIWRILAGRGYHTREQIENLLQPRLKDLAHPFSLDQMDLAVNRLVEALKNDEKILIYGDYDLDGTPGLVLLHDGLTRLGFKNLFVFQPSRLRDGYGLHAVRIDQFREQGVTLVLTVDVGITDIESVKQANAWGVDVIVTDHHLPKETLPPAIAVVNPNKGTCTSQLQHLCGTGVAFYLILALKMELSKLGLLKEDLDSKVLLDLFAIATITDMVPLVRENRVLVKHGLQQLSKPQRPGIKHLLNELGFAGKKISSQDIAFRIAPKLNALTRLEEGVRALDVLMADEKSAPALVQEALIVNQRRVQFQDKAKKISAELIKAAGTDSFIWIQSHEFHPGVVSLIASDLSNQYGVPSFVGAVLGEGKVVGSARAPGEPHNLQLILKSAESVLEKFGGHQLAAGFEIHEENADKFRELLADYFLQEKDGVIHEGEERTDSAHATTKSAPVYYDAEVSLTELDARFMGWYESLGPFGMQFEIPKLLLRRAEIKSMRKLKGSFLKYTLFHEGREIEGPWFSRAVEFPQGSQVDVIFEPQWNEYNGRRTIQALIHDMRLSKGDTL